MGTTVARSMTAVLLALAGSAAVGVVSVQGRAGLPAFHAGVALSAQGHGLSTWDRARLGSCVGWLKVSRRDLHSELDRRSACAERLGLDAAATH